MDIFFDNVEWMTFNIFLALLGVILGVVFFYISNKLLKVIIFLLWILYLPNTIYLVTDIQHFFTQWLKLKPAFQLLLAMQYITLIVIGVLTFLLGLYLLDKSFSQSKIKKNKTLITILVFLTNYLIAFGVALGKIERINSFEAIIYPLKVISSSLNLLSYPENILTIFLFGTFINFLYFFFRKKITIKLLGISGFH